MPAQSPLSTWPASKARHCCNKYRASAASDQDHVLAARFSGPVSRLGLSVVADPFGEGPSKGVLLHGERHRYGKRIELGGAGGRKGTREGGRSSPQGRLNSAPWCHSPSLWKVAVARITDSPDAEAGPQRGAFRDAHGHPSLVSPPEAVLRSHLSISSFRSLWFRTTLFRSRSDSSGGWAGLVGTWSPPKFSQSFPTERTLRSALSCVAAMSCCNDSEVIVIVECQRIASGAVRRQPSRPPAASRLGCRLLAHRKGGRN